MNTTEQQRTGQLNRLQVNVISRDKVTILYHPNTDRALFDVCDLNGRILITGEITDDVTTVETADLYPEQYIILVLDGDKVCSTKFMVNDIS
jgi:hypothetical protein